MKLIAAVDRNWGIGYKNDLLVRIPADQKFFRRETTGKTIVMGRKTLESFPGGRPLPERRNIVMTRNTSFRAEGAEVFHDLDSLLERLKTFPGEDVYIIGGASVYRQFEPLCDTALITMIDRVFEADTFFPVLREEDGWKLAEESEEQTCFDLIYFFRKYVR
ncbi:MAG: dihydrofolate reductase [Lachnospiraceae bacterium]|nr:dihydrofolate reductase [Lachnospiraceae bacterium]